MTHDRRLSGDTLWSPMTKRSHQLGCSAPVGEAKPGEAEKWLARRQNRWTLGKQFNCLLRSQNANVITTTATHTKNDTVMQQKSLTPPLLPREQEHTAIRRASNRARDGSVQVIMIQGAPGAGRCNLAASAPRLGALRSDTGWMASTEFE